MNGPHGSGAVNTETSVLNASADFAVARNASAPALYGSTHGCAKGPSFGSPGAPKNDKGVKLSQVVGCAALESDDQFAGSAGVATSAPV